MSGMIARKLLVVAGLLVLATSCAATDPPTESTDSAPPAPTAPRAPTAPPVPTAPPAPTDLATPTPPVSPDPPGERDAVEAVLPEDLLGLWASIDQGDAETAYRFVADGTYDRVSILMQARPSGTFAFTIQATGLVRIEGERGVTPTAGREAMQDPDSPSSNYDRPLDDLSPEEFLWTIENGTLFLTGQYGTVAYKWTPEG